MKRLLRSISLALLFTFETYAMAQVKTDSPPTAGTRKLGSNSSNIQIPQPLEVKLVDLPTSASSQPTFTIVVKEAPHEETWSKRASDWALAVFTAALVIETAFLVKATNRLSKGADDASKNQLRAYLDLSIGQLSKAVEAGWAPEVGGTARHGVKVVFDLFNRGQTPATSLKLWQRITVVPFGALPNDEVFQIDENADQDWGAPIINPGAHHHLEVDMDTDALVALVDAARDQHDVMIFGVVRYEDA